MDKPAPTDHKDERETYRSQVPAAVFTRIGGPGLSVASRGQLTGDWHVAVVGLGPASAPIFVYHLCEDGKAAIEVVGQPGPSSTSKLQLNPDGTFSMLTSCPPDPQFGIDESRPGEDRRHVAALPEGRQVRWNDEGSMVLLLSPRRERCQGGRVEEELTRLPQQERLRIQPRFSLAASSASTADFVFSSTQSSRRNTVNGRITLPYSDCL